MLSIYYYTKGSSLSADVFQDCRLCDRKSHVLINGRKKVEEVEKYLTGIRDALHTQDLPFEQPIREFLFSGMCRNCQQKMFGETSSKIRYKRRERR